MLSKMSSHFTVLADLVMCSVKYLSMVILNQVPWLARVDKERRMTHNYISYKILNI
jgi:hypothetical protein